MTDRDSLMAKVCENPADDVARLVYADWLEENGEAERAEFIRLQVDLPKRPDVAACPCVTGDICGECAESRRMLARQRHLFVRNHADWFPEIKSNVVMGEAAADGMFSVTRGFVASVRCRLADWVGGPCERCGGRGGWETGPHAEDCRHCHATGRTPGHGPHIVAEQPVERVEVSDMAPSETPSGWAFWRHAGLDDTDTLPAEVFDCLLDDDASYAAAGERLCWQTRAAAQSALSLALVNWARREAGLPPLDSPKSLS